MRGSLRRRLAIVTAAVVALGLAWLLLRPVELSVPKETVPREPAAKEIPNAAEPEAHRVPRPPAAADALAEGPPDLGGEVDGTWEVVDMAKVRAAMPENLYWKMSVPTSDPQVIEEREAERDRWNVEYGKVLSGTGTEDEIRAYFDLKARLSADYIELTTHLLDHYGDELPERDVGLLELARRLHRKRLEEVPRKIEEAFERKRQQDAAREAWLADEKAFRDGEDDAAGGR